ETQRNDSDSWWKKCVSDPSGEFMRKHFGPENKGKSDKAGNSGIAYLRLTKAPLQEMTVSLALASGDKSISLVEGSRLVFNDQNWSKPAAIVFQLDPKLRTQSSARFEVRSGNVTISWVIAFGVLVLLFLFFGTYHKFALPRPASDQPGTANGMMAFLGEFFAT